MSRSASTQRLVTRCLWCVLSLALAAGCAPSAKLPLGAVTGPAPVIAEPTRSRIPVVNVAKVVGWSGRAHPVAAPGTTVNAFATKLDHPRWLYVLPNGDVLVAESNAPERPEMRTGIRNWFLRLFMHEGGAGGPSANRITLLRDADGDGVAETRSIFLRNLNSPFGMALVGSSLYVANTDAVVRFPYTSGQIEITGSPTKVADLPAGPINHHWTRGLIASRDGSKLYVSVGSNSDRGERGMEVETNRAAILEIDPRNGATRVYASGMRNPIGMEWVPGSDALWTAVNEREELGSDVPPDYLTSVKPEGFYGWPYSYHGKNVDTRVSPQNPEMVASSITPDYALGPHTASMGIAYAGVTSLPTRFQNGMIVTQHGSWNRIPRSGYRVVFVPFENGKPSGQLQVLLTGFLKNDDEAQGRPAGVAIDKRGGVLIADDAGDVIWRVRGISTIVAADGSPRTIGVSKDEVVQMTTPLPTAADNVITPRYRNVLEAANARAARVARHAGEEKVDRACVAATPSPIVVSGNFTVGGFGIYDAVWRQKEGKLVFKPTTPQPGWQLNILAESLDGPDAAMELFVPTMTGSVKDGNAVYPVKLQLPRAGTWLITAQAGDSFGCFIYTLR